VLAPLVALLLSEPRQVQRPDGSPVNMENALLPIAEAKMIYTRILVRPEIVFLTPFMVYLTWFYAYT
ncbi:hypothetical protein EMMF5_006592, partial [Cystobasidiomycetes sp. EMM_F5]